MPASSLSAPELVLLVRDARAHTLALFCDLGDEQMSVPRLEHVNPPLWELGHVAFFWEAFVLRELDGAASGADDGDQLYDSFRVEHPTRWDLPLPSRRATLEYLQRIAERAIGRLAGRTPDARETYLYRLAALHEDMHGEALAYTRQTLGYAEPRPSGATAQAAPRAGACPGDVAIPGGRYLLGATDGAPFVFDNEKPAHARELAPFRIARAPVTNLEFAAFVEDRGYLRPELWSEPGWRSLAGREHPLYWRRSREGWRRAHFAREVPLEEHQPVVHVSWFEAEAWCNWAARRLPSEAEWEAAASAEPAARVAPTGARAAEGSPAQRKRRFPWGDEPPSPSQANLDARCTDCAEVGAFPAGDSAWGCRQMLGNVWEWTASAFLPYPGFVADAPYREYSQPWFGDRMVLRGGAWATRSRLVSNAYRNFFPPHRNDVFAGFRTCARQG